MPDPKFEGRPDMVDPTLEVRIDQLIYARQREWSGAFTIDRLKLRDLIVAEAKEHFAPLVAAAARSEELKSQRDEAVGRLREARDEIKHAQSCYLMDRSITGHRPLSRMDDPNLCDCDYPHELVARIDAQLGKESQ